MPVKINLKINKKKASISPYRKKKKKNDKWVSRKKKISQQEKFPIFLIKAMHLSYIQKKKVRTHIQKITFF